MIAPEPSRAYNRRLGVCIPTTYRRPDQLRRSVESGAHQDDSVERVFVVTQGGNCTAQRFHQQRGFVTDLVEVWLHRWKPPGVARR
jgi:hypothetical protein